MIVLSTITLWYQQQGNIQFDSPQNASIPLKKKQGYAAANALSCHKLGFFLNWLLNKLVRVENHHKKKKKKTGVCEFKVVGFMIKINHGQQAFINQIIHTQVYQFKKLFGILFQALLLAPIRPHIQPLLSLFLRSLSGIETQK